MNHAKCAPRFVSRRSMAMTQLCTRGWFSAWPFPVLTKMRRGSGPQGNDVAPRSAEVEALYPIRTHNQRIKSPGELVIVHFP